MNRNKIIWISALVIGITLVSIGLALAAPLEQEDVTPQVVLVLDASGSMSEYILPEELPEDLAEVIAQIDAIESDPEYIRVTQEMDAIEEEPEVKAAYEAWIQAGIDLEDWLGDNGYDIDEVMDQIEALIVDEYGCSDLYVYTIAHAESMWYVDMFLEWNCDEEGVPLTEEQRQAVRDLVPYVEDPEYQALSDAEDEAYFAYDDARDARGYEDLWEQVEDMQDELWDLQGEVDALAEKYGYPNRLDLAKLAALTLLDLSRLDTLVSGRESPVALVKFESTAHVLQSLTTDYESIEESMEELFPTGGTDIGEALEEAFNELEANGDPEQPSAIVLLSDGHTGGLLTPEDILEEFPPRAEESGTVICTVGFGNEEEEVDVDLLKGLADQTGGEYLFATGGEEMAAFFIACRQGLVSQVVDQITDVVRPGETTEAAHIEVGSEVGELTLSLNYMEGRLVMEVVDPTGNVVDVTSEGVTIEQSENVQLVEIDDPAPGEWVVRVTGEEIPEDGALFSVVVSTELRPTPTPAPPTPTPTPTPVPEPEPTFMQRFGPILLVGVGVLVLGGIVVVYLVTRRRTE